MDENHERLKGAARAGNIDALYALIREDACILDGIDAIPFFDTPLHIAAALGHVDFAMEVINLKSSLAQKLNPDGFSPLHLALQNGQKEMVLEFVGMDKDFLRVKGKGGKTPLHFVVGEGDITLLIAFLLSCPDCIRDVTNQNENALHIAVQQNLLETLEVLLGWLRRTHEKDGKLWEKQILNWKNKEGDTVLHIAVSNNQPQMIKLLLECGIEKNAQNWRGLTAMDISLLQDNNQVNTEILEILHSFGCLRASSIHANSTFVNFLRSKMSFSERSNIALSRMRKNISNSTRNALLVVLVLILTATYQSAVTPPYQLAQASIDDLNTGSLESFSSNINVEMDPLALSFSIFNAIDFLVTLLVTLLILPWVPYGHLLHLLLLLVFLFFVASMGMSLLLTTSVIGIAVFGFFAVITLILCVFIVRNKVKDKKIYRECLKEFGDRVRLQKHQQDDAKKK